MSSKFLAVTPDLLITNFKIILQLVTFILPSLPSLKAVIVYTSNWEMNWIHPAQMNVTYVSSSS